MSGRSLRPSKTIGWDPAMLLYTFLTMQTNQISFYFFLNNVLSKPWSSPITKAMELPLPSRESIPETNRFHCQETFPQFSLKFPLLNFIPLLDYKPPVLLFQNDLASMMFISFKYLWNVIKTKTSVRDGQMFCYFHLLWQIEVWSPLHIYCPVWTQLYWFIWGIYTLNWYSCCDLSSTI